VLDADDRARRPIKLQPGSDNRQRVAASADQTAGEDIGVIAKLLNRC